MPAIIDSAINAFISKKLFAFLIVSYFVYRELNMPPEYFAFAAMYVGGQSVVDFGKAKK